LSEILNKKNQGFTLIEVLVVIAIIGILAGIIIFSLKETKDKAKDARIIDEMSQIRSVANMHYNDNSYSFNGFSCGVVNMSVVCNDITAQGGDLIDPIPVSLDGQDYCVEAKLNSGAWWCVDAQGRSAKYDTSTMPTEPACDDTSVPKVYTCE